MHHGPEACMLRFQTLLISILLLATPAMGQEDDLPENTGITAETAADATAHATIEEPPRNYFIPIPVIYYTPETKLALGVSAAYIYRTGDADPSSRPSTLGGIGIYTTKSQILFAVGGEHYWDQDRQKLAGGLSYQKFPNDFFGLGNDTDPDFSEGYTDESSGIGIDYLRQLWPRIHFGGGVTLGNSSITETSDGDLLESGLVPGSKGGVVTGAGLAANYDSRENVGYPLRGGFHQVSWRLYSDALGGDFNLNSTSLDLRQYLHLGGKSVLALRGMGIMGGGNMPFQIMPALGGDSLMRGYFAGRFRERKAVAAQAEARFYIWKRLGGAVFGAMGQVGQDYGDLAASRFHYSGGAGLRILLIEQEGMNLRMDFGFGEDQSGFYLGFGEVF
ncbi:hypothetical protein DRQ53_04110 [bacterium]|nr:MAG: hypothetical protein DRQ53_04110 [bacterium]